MEKDYSKLTKNQLAELLKKDVKIANQRIKRLEKAGYTDNNAYRYLTNHNLSGVKHSKTGHITFSSATKNLKRNELLKRYNTVNKFLEAKTSTIKGIKSAYKKSYETLKSKPIKGLEKLTFNQYISIMESEALESFKSNFGSSQLVNLLNISRKDNINDIVNLINNSVGKTLIDIEAEIEDLQNNISDFQQIDYGEDIFD